jgi:hypothetical protein
MKKEKHHILYLFMVMVFLFVINGNSGLASDNERDEWLSNDLIAIDREIVANHSSGKTTVNLIAKPHKALASVNINEYVPNCLAGNIKDISFTGMKPNEVKDRLVSWHFEYLKEPVPISYSASNIIDEDCWNNFSVYVTGKRLELKQELPAFTFGSALLLLVVVFTVWHNRAQDKFKNKR